MDSDFHNIPDEDDVIAMATALAVLAICGLAIVGILFWRGAIP
jgi:hypothetical protein